MTAQKHANISIFIPHLGCPYACSFCDQRIISGNETPMTPMQAKQTVQKAFLQITDPGKRAQTEIAFFGGSFTAIGKEMMEAYLTVCTPYLGAGKFSGIRISTRPDCIDEEILDLLQRYGVTAIELGVQSLCDEILQKNHRGHTASDAEHAVKLIRDPRYKFSLGLQMMIGLYGESKESLYHTASEILRLRPDTLRIYPTVVLKGTDLDKLLQSGAYTPMGLEEAVEFTADWLPGFEAAGIKVIKVGLHASTDVEHRMTGGIYHPAFRELCESRIYRKRIERLLQGKGPGRYDVYLPQREFSKAVGQNRENFTYFEARGYLLKLRAMPQEKGIGKDEIRIFGAAGL